MKDYKGKVVVVTGAASGIGFGLAERFAMEGARVVLSDLNEAAAREKASLIGAVPITANVAIETDVEHLVSESIKRFGHIDLFVSNAGIAPHTGIDTTAANWEKTLAINLLSHVHAAKHALPGMLERGAGHFLNTASAAGLFVEFDSLTYTVTKHAAVGFAEWLALAYGDRGIRVSLLVPAGVRTPMAANDPDILSRSIEVGELVDKVMAALAEERFLISTHAFVDELFALKGRDYEAYMERMRTRRDEARKRNHPIPGTP